MVLGITTDDIVGGVGSALDKLTEQAKTYQNSDAFKKDGFIVPPVPETNGILPYQKVPYNNVAAGRVRRLMTWFVPEIGAIKMYINPQSLNFSNNKVIQNTRTKGGYVLQYWGEELETISVSGTTGSSGIEGLNVLYEIYRSEQYVFDNYGLILAANAEGNTNLFNSIESGIETLGTEIGGTFGNIVGGTLGAVAGLAEALSGDVDPIRQLSPNNLPTLASLAFSIEMYYHGWVRRGYFKNFNFREEASSPGLFSYDFNFIVTQKRGYRTNFMPWHRSPVLGPSNNSTSSNLSFK